MNTITVKSNRFDDPNLALITNFLQAEFPELHGCNVEARVEAIVEELIGSRQYRLAGKPMPESEVAIRDVVRIALEANKAIPVLIVGGPKKTLLHESIDVAELSALRILACINRKVQEHHGAGLDINLRLEDATGHYLEGTAPEMLTTMEQYTGDLAKLTRILGYDFINVIKETEIINPSVLAAEADTIFPVFLDYLKESTLISDPAKWADLSSFRKLQAYGWQGMIPPEMREYYHYRYSHLFPQYNELQRLEVVARYLGITLGRHRLKALGINPEWNGKFIQISFAPPIVGEPQNRISTRLYYRSVPLSHSKKHIPFWRAKGILKLNGSARISLANWNEPLDLNPFEVIISKGSESVVVKADYVIDTHE